jgi:hypothetical protein
MALVISLDVAELAATRFATSPLGETIRALQLLAKPDPPAVNLPWLRWARAQLERRPLRVARLWPLVVTGLPGGTYPEFLIPAPAASGRPSPTSWPGWRRRLPRRSGPACAACSPTAVAAQRGRAVRVAGVRADRGRDGGLP